MVRMIGAALAGWALAVFGAAAGRHVAMLPAKTEPGRETLREGKRASTNGALATSFSLTCLAAFAGPVAAGILGGGRAGVVAAAAYAVFEIAAQRNPMAFVPPAWRWGGLAAELAAAAAGAAAVRSGLAAQPGLRREP